MATPKTTSPDAPAPSGGTVTRLKAWPKDVKPKKAEKSKPAEE